MTTLAALDARALQGNAGRRRLDGRRLDLAVALLSGWLVGGTYLDAWAHHTVAALDSFLTPWHAVLYSGFLAVSAMVLSPLAVNSHAGAGPRARWSALPAGYGAAAVGVVLFAAAGGGDALWHALFGIEADIEALLSPPHLLLATGAGLIVSAPLRAVWARADAGAAGERLARTDALALLLALAWTLSLFTFFTEFASPLSVPWPAPDQETDPAILGQSLGVASILVHAALIVGTTLPAVRRWELPPGGLTLVFGVNAALTVWVHEQFHLLAAGLLAGLAADLVHAGLGRGRRVGAAGMAIRRDRLYAAAVPMGFGAAYFAALAATSGVSWSVHLWAGAVALAGATGWLVSLLDVTAPPAADAPRNTAD